MYPRIEDAGHYSPFHTIPFSVAPAVQVGLGRGLVGLFHKARNPVGAPLQGLAPLDVAKAGGRITRLDAKGDQIALLGRVLSLGHRLGKRFLVRDKLVGRKHPHQLVGVALSNPQGSHGDGRCGVAAQRLDDVVGLHLRQTQGLILASAL
jgi:hypothetical protein